MAIDSQAFIDQLNTDVNREQSIISGYALLQTSTALSNAGHLEVEEGLVWSGQRCALLTAALAAWLALLEHNYPDHPSQFAAKEVIDEFNKLVADLTHTVDEFDPPVIIPLVVGREERAIL